MGKFSDQDDPFDLPVSEAGLVTAYDYDAQPQQQGPGEEDNEG